MLKRNEGKGSVRCDMVWGGNGTIGTMITLMAAFAFVLVMASGVALAQAKTDRPEAERTAAPIPSKVHVRGIPSDGLTAPIGMDGRLLGHPEPVPVADDGVGRLLGRASATYPRVGELYYGHVVVGNVNPSRNTPVMAEVSLPKETDFYIDPGNANTRVRCFLENFNTGASAELTGDNCPQRPTQGIHGAQFAPKAGARDLAGNALDQSPTTTGNQPKTWTFTVKN